MASHHNGPQHITQFRPLPEEVLRMSEADTACQYCGISYLLLTKYERMESHVRELDAEMASLKKYVEERPQMLKRLESLLELQKNIEEDRQVAETNMREWQARYRKEVDETERLRVDRRDLKKELDRSQQNIHELETQAQIRASENSRAFTNMQCEIIQIQNDIARMKGHVKSSITASVLEAVSLTSKQVAMHVTAHQQHVVRVSVDRAESKSLAVVSGLNKQIETLRDSLEESRNRNERLSNELTAYRRDYSSHIESQKSYIQGIQANSVALEERLHQANRDVMDLSSQRERLYTEKIKLQNTYDALKHDYDHVRGDYDKRIVALQMQMSQEQMEHKTQVSQLESLIQEKNTQSLHQSDDAFTQTRQALAKKDEQLMQMERTIRELNTNLAIMRSERVKTIEAHQNRIKQLQERFLEDLKAAGNEEASRVEADLKRVLSEDKEKALCQLRQSMQKEMDETRDQFLRQIESLKSSTNLQNVESQKRVEDEWRRRYAELEDQVARLQALNSSDNERSQTKIRALESELSELRTRSLIEDASNDRTRTADLTSTIEKRDAEIMFLKETVRLECEERMGLVAMVSKFRQQSQQKPLDSREPLGSEKSGVASMHHGQDLHPARARSGTPLSAIAPAAYRSPSVGGNARQRPHSSSGRNIKNTPQISSNQSHPNLMGIPKEARNFEMLIQAATAKKERKMAKQLSLRRM